MARQPVKTRMIHARVDPALKQSAERVFARIGISTTEAIGIFLKQVELHKCLPFSAAIPNAETSAAMKEANNPAALNRYRSFRELREKIQ